MRYHIEELYELMLAEKKVKFELRSKTAKVPKQATDGSAGFDLYADMPEHTDIVFGHHTIIPTNVAMAIPKGFVGLIKPRSGWAVKAAVDTLAGVIDSDYRGEVAVILTKEKDDGEVFNIEHGDRIAQIIFVPVLTESEVVDSLDETDRGANGFGSTGVQ